MLQPGREFARFIVGVHDAMAFQDEDALFIGVVVDGGFARAESIPRIA